MNRKTSLFWVIAWVIGVATMVGCSSQPDVRKASVETVSVPVAEAELFLPKSLWQKIETLPQPAEAKPTHKEAEKPSAESQDQVGVVRLAPLVVRLVEETSGTLKRRNVELSFGKGGGTLDLANFVDDEVPGDFVFGLQSPGMEEADKVRVFYLGNAQPRTIGSQRYGSDCDATLELTSFFRKRLAAAGLRVTTKKNLYVTTLSGSYVIAYHKDEQWYETQLTVFDSRHDSEQCRSAGHEG